MPVPQFFLSEGKGYVKRFDESHEVFTTFGASVTAKLFTTNADHPKCMQVSVNNVNTGVEDYVSDIIPGIKYLFEAGYRVSSGVLRANLYDQVGGATIWTATRLISTSWANIYQRVTVPANCSVIRVRFQKVMITTPAYIDDVRLQGNSLYRDPDGYDINFPAVGGLKVGGNGIRTLNLIARHAEFNGVFPNTTASAMSRLIKSLAGATPNYFDDGNVIHMTNYLTVYVSKSYNFSGVSQGGGGATLFKAATSAARPVGSTAMESTELANSQYAAIGTDNNTAATVPVTVTNKYGYIKANFQATDYGTTANVRQFTVTLKAGADDQSSSDENGVELYAWNGSDWSLLDTSRNASRQSLTYTTSDKELARRFVDTGNKRIRIIAKTRTSRDSTSALFMNVYYINVGINDHWSKSLNLTNKIIPEISAIRNVSTRREMLNDVDYRREADRDVVIVDGVYAHLDGGGQYFYATDANFPESGITGDMTIQAWVRVDAASISDINDIVRKLQTSGQYCYTFRFTANGKLRLLISSDGTATSYMTTSGVVAEADTWIHVAVVYDSVGGTCTFYKNGVAVAAAAGSLPNSIFDGTSNFNVGSYVGAHNLDGSIARVAIFDDMRTTSGNKDAIDVYAHLDGGGQYFYATDANFPESGITGDMTIQAWVRVDAASISDINDIVRKLQTSGQYCYTFRFTANGKLRLLISSDGTATSYMTTSGVVAEADTWIHVAVVYDSVGGTCTFYKNGVAVAAAAGSLPNSIFDGTSNFNVGSYVGAHNLDGSIARVAIFDDQRSEAEILASYNDSDEDLSSAGNIIGFWDFNDDGSAIVIDNKQGDSGRDLTPYNGGNTTYNNCGREEANEILKSYNNPDEDLSGAGNIIGFWKFNDDGSAIVIDNKQGDSGRDLTPYNGGNTTYNNCGREEAASAGDVIRIKYNQYYEAHITDLAEPTIYPGDITAPRGDGAMRLATLKPIG